MHRTVVEGQDLAPGTGEDRIERLGNSKEDWKDPIKLKASNLTVLLTWHQQAIAASMKKEE
jgi:hypothetical protein